MSEAPNRHKARWTDADDDAIRARFWCGESDSTIARAIERTVFAVKDRRSVLNLSAWSQLRPSKKLWTAIATRAANEARLDPVAVLAGDHHKPFVRARWQAWRCVRDMGYSLSGIGHVSGFHHTTVMHGVEKARAG